MPRIRTIKPEFWRNDELATISPEAALLAIGLLNHSDDEGYFSANPKLIEADIFPLRELSRTTTVLIKELSDIGYIALYQGSDKKKYGEIVNFKEHQVINKPKTSKIKGLDLVPYESGSHTLPLPAGKERKGKERKGKGKESMVKSIFEYWQQLMNHPQSKLDDKRKRIIQKCLSSGYDVEQLKTAIDGCKKTPWNMGENPDGSVFDSIELILRDAEHVDRFIKNNHTPPSPQSSSQKLSNQNQQAALAALDNMQ